MNVLDTRTLRQVGGRLGSTPAGIYEDAQGRCFYVKTLESAAYARNELIAARLYRLAGAPTLDYLATTQPHQVATTLIRLDKKRVSQLDETERRQAQRWFAIHAWTANWDAAGFHGDNQGVADGVVLTLDMGGALEFRAMGDPKGRAFGSHVGELDSLRHDPNNPFAVALFGDMDDVALRDAIRMVTQIPDHQIRQVIGEHGGSTALADKMVARKADMARRLAADDTHPCMA
ncbi:MAG: hypothetical protein AB7G62_14930 [Magnetospirillum sp.]